MKHEVLRVHVGIIHVGLDSVSEITASDLVSPVFKRALKWTKTHDH